MSARKTDARRAAEVVETIQESRNRIEAFGLTEESLLQTDTIEMRSIADALLMCVLRVTEESGKLSEGAKDLHPEIDWAGIAGMRNYLAHDYGNVDRRMVWAAISDEFDSLERACRQIIAESKS